MSEESKACVRRLTEEVWNRGNFALVDELVAADYTGHSPTSGETHGREGYTGFFQTLRGSFPDIEFTIEELIAEGDSVVSRWRARGTHLSEYRGLPPTGRSGLIAGTSIFHITEDRVIECWTNADDLGLMQLVGAIPARTG